MRYSRKKNLIIISCLAALVLSIGLGFAAFSTTLKINGSAKVKPDEKNFKIIFADTAEEGGVYTQLPVIPTSNPSDLEKYDGEIATEGTKITNLGGVFTEDGQSIVYDFFVYNVGKYDAYLTNIEYTYKEGTYSKRTCTNISSSESTFSESCNDIIIKVVLAGETYTGSTIFTDHVLAKGEYEPIQVVIEYPEGSDLPDGEMDIEFSDIELIFGTIDEAHPLPDSALMANSGNVFRFSGITRNQVESIETVNSIDVPYDAIDSCDASAKQDETVIAWYKDEDNNGLYELYIGGEGSIKVTSGESLFEDYTNVISVDLKYFDTSKVKTMSFMFNNCTKLENLNLDNFDGSSVTDMNNLVSLCSSLKSFSLNNFTAPNLTNIVSMFASCDNLKIIQMNNFSAENLEGFSYWNTGYGCYIYIHYGLQNIERIELRNLYIPNNLHLEETFTGYNNLKYVDIRGINSPKASSLSNMFYNCQSLTSEGLIGLEDLKTKNVTNMSSMFYNCQQLTSLNISNFNTSKVTNMNSMFENCLNIKDLDLGNFDTSNVKTMSFMFNNCTKLENLNLDNFDGSSVTDMNNLVSLCSSLKSFSLNNFTAPNLTNIVSMFASCNNLKIIQMNNFSAENLEGFSYWNTGYGCYIYLHYGLQNIERIELRNLYIPNNLHLEETFTGYNNLKYVDIRGINSPKASSLSNMFYNCQSLTSEGLIGLEDLKTKNVTNMSSMFYNCQQLTSLDLYNFDFTNVTSYESMLGYISTNISIKLKDTIANRTFMNNNFSNYTNITWV